MTQDSGSEITRKGSSTPSISTPGSTSPGTSTPSSSFSESTDNTQYWRPPNRPDPVAEDFREANFLYAVAVVFEGNDVTATAFDHTDPANRLKPGGTLTVVVACNRGFPPSSDRYFHHRHMHRIMSFVNDFAKPTSDRDAKVDGAVLLACLEDIVKYCAPAVRKHFKACHFRDPPSLAQFEQGLAALARVFRRSSQIHGHNVDIKFPSIAKSRREGEKGKQRSTVSDMFKMTLRAWRFRQQHSFSIDDGEITVCLDNATSRSPVRLTHEAASWFKLAERLSRIPNALLTILMFKFSHRLRSINFDLLSAEPPSVVRECRLIRPCPWCDQGTRRHGYRADVKVIRVHCEIQIVHHLIHKASKTSKTRKPKQPQRSGTEKRIMVGCTKKCCPDCWHLVDQIGSKAGEFFNVQGPHGMACADWWMTEAVHRWVGRLITVISDDSESDTARLTVRRPPPGISTRAPHLPGIGGWWPFRTGAYDAMAPRSNVSWAALEGVLMAAVDAALG